MNFAAEYSTFGVRWFESILWLDEWIFCIYALSNCLKLKIISRMPEKNLMQQTYQCKRKHIPGKRLLTTIWNGYLQENEQLSIFTNPSARAWDLTRSIFKRSLTGLNSEFSFSLTRCLTKAEEISLPYYFPIAGKRIISFIPVPRVLVLCEMKIERLPSLNTLVYLFILLNDTKIGFPKTHYYWCSGLDKFQIQIQLKIGNIWNIIKGKMFGKMCYREDTLWEAIKF